jgi:hypothetical protein
MQERGKQQGRRQDDRDREQAGQGRRGESGQGRQSDLGREGGEGGGRDVNRQTPMGRREENPQRAPREDEQNREIDEDEQGLGEEGGDEGRKRGDRDTQYWPRRHEGGERREQDPFASD